RADKAQSEAVPEEPPMTTKPTASSSVSPTTGITGTIGATAAATAADLHVVLGAGQIGTLVAQQLLAAGHRVRMVRRRVAAAPLPGVELVVADLRDPDQAAAALRGAGVAYHCVNPVYTEWATALPAQ